MVSLFPAKTFKGSENGLRIDLAQTLPTFQPHLVRFPGGCVAHGKGIDNIYDWKGSIGPLEARKPLFNLWVYHSYQGVSATTSISCSARILALSLCLLSLPVFLARISHINAHSYPQRHHRVWDSCAVCLGEEMEQYTQDIFSTLSNTPTVLDNEWGAKRAAAGHSEPSNLKYIGIGNEDLVSEVFIPRSR